MLLADELFRLLEEILLFPDGVEADKFAELDNLLGLVSEVLLMLVTLEVGLELAERPALVNLIHSVYKLH